MLTVSGIFVMVAGFILLFMDSMSLLPSSIILHGATITCIGFSTYIVDANDAICDRYLDRIHSAAATILDDEDSDRVLGMASNASPVTWKHTATRLSVASFFVIGSTILLLLPFGFSALAVLINVATIVVAMIVLMPTVSIMVKGCSKSTLLERVAARLESSDQQSE